VRRLGIAMVIVVACTLVSTSAAQALRFPTYTVSGSFSGTGSFDFTCGGIHQTATATGDVALFGSSTLAFDFCIAFPAGIALEFPVTSGSLTITNADGSVSGTVAGFVEPTNFTPDGYPYHFDITVTGGAGRFEGATGTIGLDGFFGIGAATIDGTASGTVSFGPPIPTVRHDCQNGGWRVVVDTQGHSFVNQGKCVAFVERQRRIA
jgi:hypothetical protein